MKWNNLNLRYISPCYFLGLFLFLYTQVHTFMKFLASVYSFSV